MATVNKDFKIKSGLIVEGTTATVNGYDILTKKQGDQDYIVGLIGGTSTPDNTPDTVVKRNGDGSFSAQNITLDGILNTGDINVGNIGEISNTNGNLLVNANDGNDLILHAPQNVRINTSNADIILNPDGSSYLWSANSANRIATEGYVDDSSSGAYNNAVSDANAYTDSAISTEVTNRNSAISTAQSNAESYADGVANAALQDANTYTDSSISTEVTNRNSAINSAISTEVTNRNSAIATAKSEAISTSESYTDTAITNLNLAGTYDALGAATTAENNAKAYTDTEIAALVDSAPAMLDTLNELAAAISNNPNYASDVANLVAGKQDTLTTGNGIVIDNNLIYIPTSIGSGVSITPSTVEIDRAVVDTWYDAAGAANTAQGNAEDYADTVAGTAENNAKSYADSLASNYDAAGSAQTAQNNAEDYTDTRIGSLVFAQDVAGEINAVASGTLSQAESYTDNAINALNTDAIEEGNGNLYFTDWRSKQSAADLLTGATLTNLTITGSGQGLTITAENGVADSTTSDLAEGSNLYFTNQRVLDAVSGSNIEPSTIDITWVRREEATYNWVQTASTAVVHTFPNWKGSAKYLIRVQNNGKSHLTELLATTDSSNNVAVVEYGTIYTSESPLATATVEWNAGTSQYELKVTTANNSSEVLVAATLVAYGD